MSSTSTALTRARASTAAAVGIITIVFAAVLAIGAVLIALGDVINRDNSIVGFVIDFAGVVDGPFSRSDGVFSFDSESLTALTNWGLAAAVWLLIGRVLGGLISK